ncbi:MAG: adenylyltransferase/cytidyltransferase family protein [Patescibacteria group bacterium]
MNDIFGPGSNVGKRVFRDHNELQKQIEACRVLGFKIVLTSGTFDLLHIGHCRYLEQAKGILGAPDQTVLVVGIDSDEKVHARKDRNTLVAEDERIEIVCHQRHVDLVFLKQFSDERWELIKTVTPDVLVVSETTKEQPHTAEEQTELAAFCGEVRVLPAQATTSTTARIRLLLIGRTELLEEKVEAFYRDMKDFFDKLKGGNHGP